ncbi:excisionase family DNA-binding protein [Rubritalea spongiae]|uniref:Excisionase family DNA-binding protein n=2 Tax=Rubritalea spongiae TaxID=430797 RepID=A0ABW5E444_9BACT
MDTRKLITKKEAASILSSSVRTVERIIASGAIEKIKIRGSVKLKLSQVLQIVEKGC